MKQLNRFFGWIVLLLCMLTTGCEDVPQKPRLVQKIPIPDDALMASGRGGYEWFSTSGKFHVAAQSDLEVFTAIDRAVVEENLQDLTFTERTEPFRPEGMEDDVYEIYNRLAEPYFDTNPFLTIPFTATDEGMFSVNATGDRLVVLGKQLEVWDLKTAKQLSSSPLRSSKCSQVIWDLNPEHALVMDNSGIHRVIASSGQVLKTWKPPQSQEPVFMTRAANSATCVVSTTSKKMFAFGEDLQTNHEYKGPQLDFMKISIRADGNCVLAVCKDGAIRWHISPTREELEKIGRRYSSKPLLSLFAGDVAEYLVEPSFCEARHTSHSQRQLKALDINPRIHASCKGTGAVMQEWLTNCMSRPDSTGTRQYFLQDLQLESALFSLEFPLGPEPVLEMCTNQSTDVVAIRDAKQLRIYNRQCWKDFDSTMTIDRLANLANEGRFEQIELAANALRKQRRLRHNYGESFYSNLATKVGNNCSLMERDASWDEKEKYKPILKKLDQWKGQGSEFALLVSGFRHYETMVYSNSQNNRTDGENRERQIDSDLQQIRKTNKPSIASLRLELLTALFANTSIEQLQPLIKQQIELFPYSTSNHISLVLPMQSIERSGYLTTVADLLPKPHADLFYARVTTGLEGTVGSPMSEESGISGASILRAGEALLSTNELWLEQVEFMIRLATRAKRMDLALKFTDYHVRKFPTHRFQREVAEVKLFNEAKSAMNQ